jgi:UDP-N-acetylglucosamine--N-acetylmuramyl-(pentapeptide) pyrophosphoryl-undecaprenol N-acetylglucosamine transferase
MEPVAMLAAGGTGGHLFPALALAQELGRRGIVVDLMTDTRGDRYGAGFPARQVHQIPSATFVGRSPVAAARTAVTLLSGVWAAYRQLGHVSPRVVVGFGGYPSVPPLAAAVLRGIPTALHEQNAALGRANRLLSRRVSAIATSFETVHLLDPSLAAKVRLTGNPVRDAVIERAAAPYRASAQAETFRLLVFGGSQGARFFSDAVPPALVALPDRLRQRLYVVQQCREEDLDRVRRAYAESGIRAELAAFFTNLPELMAASHLVIGRAGASSVAELAVMGRPSILVPLPHALDNDQLHNARRLAEAGAAWCIEQKELTTERLSGLIAELVQTGNELARAAVAAKGVGRADAASRLADLVEELMHRRASARPQREAASVTSGPAR